MIGNWQNNQNGCHSSDYNNNDIRNSQFIIAIHLIYNVGINCLVVFLLSIGC